MANKSESINNKKEYTVGVDLAKGKDLTVKVNVDVSDALRGLKAVQREAKKAAQAMKELENVKRSASIFNISVNSTENPEKIAEAIKEEMKKMTY